MKISFSISEIKIENPVASIGIFDGVHVAHKKIINRLIETAKNADGSSLIVTLWPHPRNVLHSGSEPLKLITTLEEKIKLIEETGIDNLLILPFDAEMAGTGFEDFVGKILIESIGIRYLVVGFNHHFGKNREGNFEKLQQLSKKYKFGLEQLGPVILNEEKVSSSVIRELLISGDIATANIFLGYMFSLTGEVVQGRGLGRQLGFPTANIQLTDQYKIVPGDGVYAVKADVGDKQNIKGMLNIGFRPTIKEKLKERIIEVHLIDYHDDLYNKKIKISFAERVRDEKKFNSTDELKMQLEKDRNVVVSILS